MNTRRGFLGICAASAALAGTARDASLKAAGPRDYSHPGRIFQSGFFGDGAKMYCLANRSRSMMLSTVFVSGDGHVAVVDGGEYGDSAFLVGFLSDLGGTVDYWFLTHAHSDHYGALSSILGTSAVKRIKIRQLVYSFPDIGWFRQYEPKCLPHLEIFRKHLAACAGRVPVRPFATGERIRLGTGVEFEVLNDVDETITANAVNNASICMTATVCGRRIMITGDLGAEGGDRLVSALGAKRMRHDILFMPHHGQSATRKSFFEAVKPEVAIWPTTDWIWDNVADFGLHGLEPGPGSGNLDINYYKCYLQEIGVRRQFVLTKDVVFS